MKDILTKKTIYLLLFATLFLSLPANALSVKHSFNAFIGPFNASVADFEYQLTDNRYAVYSNIKTHGLFNTLYPFEALYSTTGFLKKDKMQTDTYKYQSKSRFSKRTKDVIYSSKGIPLQIISTKNGKEKIKKVNTTENVNDTTDLQTVVAAIANQYNKTQNCNAKMHIFDGKRRFDVIFEDLGKDTIEKDENSPFYGEATKCSMYIDKLKEDGDDMLWQLTSDSPIYFWIMKDKESKAPFIAKIMVEETPLGKMNVYTTNIEVTK